MELHVVAWIVAGVFTILACFTSSFLIFQHLRYYTDSKAQRHIVRILLFVPIYAVDSWLSLRFKGVATYFDVIRDCYGAFVIWSFYKLLEGYLDGEENIIEALEKRGPIQHPPPLCCVHSQANRKFLLRTKQLILQYVVIKPILAIITMILELNDVYQAGNFEPKYGYLWITILDNFSITFSLYALALFYLAMKAPLDEYRPISKFLCIKAVVFFSWWQGVLISILTFTGAIHDVEDYSSQEIANGLQDFIICIEMFLVAIAHAYAFPYTPYKGRVGAITPLLNGTAASQGSDYQLRPLGHATSDVLNFREDLDDTYSTFHPDALVQTIPGAKSVRSKAGALADRLEKYKSTARKKRGNEDSSTDEDLVDDLDANLHHHGQKQSLLNNNNNQQKQDFALSMQSDQISSSSSTSSENDPF